MPVSKLVGARVKRREDPRLIRGLGQYVDDVNLPNTLHVAILRSPYAHAKIKSLEVDAARQHPGIVAVEHDQEDGKHHRPRKRFRCRR